MSKEKHIIHQSTKSGRIINTAGNNQRISITRHTIRQSSSDWTDDDEFENEDEWEEEESYSGGSKDIIAPIGKNAKVYINGKRVK